MSGGKVVVADARWRDDSYFTHKWNHRHEDGTTVAHEADELCSEIRFVGIPYPLGPGRSEAIRESIHKHFEKHP